MTERQAGVPAERVRIIVWIWGTGIADFAAMAQPGLLQSENLPWLVRSGCDVEFAVFSLERDRARAEAAIKGFAEELNARVPGANVRYSLTLTSGYRANSLVDQNPHEIKGVFFEHVVRTAIEKKSLDILAFADMFFGNGSLRNLVVYAQKPRVTLSGNYLRVKREPFIARYEAHRRVTGGADVSNARTVDMALDTLIDAFEASSADRDESASFRTGVSIRHLSDDLYTFTTHVPTPLLCRFEQSDYEFFDSFAWDFHLIDHLWPGMLIAQNRWRAMTSSDQVFFAELNDTTTESGHHRYPTEPGMRFNDDFFRDHLHGRAHQLMLFSLRRERLPGDSGR
jgi:hypothetical protein